MPETPPLPPKDEEASTSLSSLIGKLSECVRPFSKSATTLLETGEVTKSEAVRRELRKECLENLYFLVRGPLGYKDLVPHVHLPFCRFLTTFQNRRKLSELPRGFFKTTCVGESLPIWLAINTLFERSWNSLSPSKYHHLCRFNTLTNAQETLHAIRAHLDTNQLLRWLFPELIPRPGDVWTDERVWIIHSVDVPELGKTVDLDFRIDAIGVGGSATRRHFDGISDDDLVDEDEAESPTQMQKVINEYKRSESLLTETSQGRMWFTGTRWSFADWISYVGKHEPGLDRYWIPAERGPKKTVLVSVQGKDVEVQIGEPTFPERYPRTELARIKHKQGPYIYSCFYLLDPVPEELQVFHPEWIQRVNTLPRNLRWSFCTDPAISTKSTADYTGIVGVGTTPKDENGWFEIFVGYAKRFRVEPNDLIHEMYEITEQWRPAVFGLENQGFQRALQYPIQLLRPQYKRGIPLELVKWPKQTAKENRIKFLQPYFAQGRVWIMEGLEDLVGELLDYPHAEHDDLMDALAYAVFLANPASVTQQDRINEWDYDVEGNLILSSDSVMDALEKKHAGLSANELVERAWQPMGGSNEWS
jgi:predicted phage terminase large subunit-like protein